MTKQPIEIQVDVKRQFDLLRQTTFKDPLCFIDEDIQNAERAGAKHVSIYFKQDALVIENDGAVLDDPQVLFTMGKSGWTEEVKANENPFGLGFFSNIPTSRFIEIYSGHHHVVFDERETLTIYNEQVETYTDGFTLILHDFSLPDIYTWHIEERVRAIGKFCENIMVSYQHQPIEKVSRTQGDGLPFELAIADDDQFIGWLSFDKHAYTSQDVVVYYKGRLVTKLTDFYYVKGELHLNDHVLTLQSPDRKDIIRDEKYRAFNARILEYVQTMANMALLQGNEDDIKVYEEALMFHAQLDDLRYRLPFSVFDGEKEEDMSYLEGVALALTKNENIKTLGEAEVYLRQLDEEAREQEEHVSLIIELNEEEKKEKKKVEKKVEKKEKTSEKVATQPATQHNTSPVAVCEKPTTDMKEEVYEEDEEIEEPTQPVVNKPKMYLQEDAQDVVFWICLEEVPQFKKRIQLIKQYGVRLIVAQNKIEEKMLTSSTDHNVYHLQELKEELTIHSYITNKELTIKEQRAMLLLDMMSRMYGFEQNIFEIGDVMVTKSIDIPQLSLSYENIETDITVVANKANEKVYIDRTVIQSSMLSEHLNETIEMSDYKFILFHLKQIIEEICLLESNTNKNKLYEQTIMALAIA